MNHDSHKTAPVAKTGLSFAGVALFYQPSCIGTYTQSKGQIPLRYPARASATC